LSGYKQVPDDVQKDRVKDILMTQKHLTDIYNTASSEADCPALHNELLNILQEEHKMEYRIYDEMKKRGWYDTKKANNEDVKELYNEFSKIKNELGL
jgi:spore coat protein CotF